ncbi:vascular endothelial growth factor receptor kdr-like [Anopheles darlingi]|uniref:vascular endothelial growth factor receptor kdr-like n=1 Tax=Anopheles darlingi TaxID=43151 RepID=UPI0021005245|nr:vascular endothelial growth factor receptor kdr-like [Anopheles darlingi]
MEGTVLIITLSIMSIGMFDQLALVRAQDNAISDEANDSFDLPQIEWSVDEVVLGYGDTWNVSCKCNKPIAWKPFDPEYKWDPPNITVSIYKTTDINMPYGSVLIITNASALMVGRYYCGHFDKLEKDPDEMVLENVASSIYVYVEDPHQLVVPDPVKSYNNSEGVVVLCKPSYPDVFLELCDKTSQECAATPDPTKGFFIPDNLDSVPAELYCKANGMSYTVYPGESVNDGLLKPTIISNIGDIVPIDKTVRLTCSFEGPLNVNIQILWKMSPRYEPAEIDPTISVGEQTKSRSQWTPTQIFKRDLIIQKATQAHRRTYRCEAIVDNNNTYYHNFKLQVRETPDDFVILSAAHNQTVVNRRVNRNGEMLPIEIIIRYKSYPALSIFDSYQWSRDNGAAIITNGDYKHNVTEDYINLRINQPTVHDSDIYTLVVHAGTAKAMYNISIFVYDKPSLSMHNIMAAKGEPVYFLCGSVAYPLPEMWFFFQPCNEVPWGNCSMVIDAEAEWQEGTQETKLLIWSTVSYNLVADEPGIMYCKANNSEGNAMTHAYLLLEDVSEYITLEIVEPKGLITVGDNVTFTCSTFDTVQYNVDVVFEHNGRVDERIVIHEDSLIHKVQLTLYNVSLNHTGDISCHVIFTDNHKLPEKRSIHMEVIEAIAPHLRSGDVNQTLIVHVLKPIQLVCDVVGVPEPKITWFKDGEPFAYYMTKPTNTTSITIPYANPMHSGLYECMAENKKGNITITRIVTVRSTAWNQPPMYVTVVLLMLTIVFALSSVFFYMMMKKISRVLIVKTNHEQIAPLLESS